MTITLGLWAVPLTLTLALFGWAVLSPTERAGDYSFDIMPLVRMAAAVIGALLVWLVWALAR